MEPITLADGRMLRYRRNMPLVMGILNCTPDSFSDGAVRNTAEQVERALAMIAAGSDILDIGGESTRPGASEVSQQEEISRVVPVIRTLREHDRHTVISIDTKKAAVARAALLAGADIINDISGLSADRDMLEVVAESQAPVILMHMQGNPENMQQHPEYEDVTVQVRGFLLSQADKCRAAGLPDNRIILDPGFGFGKTFSHNAALFRELKSLRECGYPVLVGVSRKSMIGQALDVPVDQRLEGSLSLAVMAAERGADILRVHDINETVRVLKMRRAILEG